MKSDDCAGGGMEEAKQNRALYVKCENTLLLKMSSYFLIDYVELFIFRIEKGRNKISSFF